jgi:hypothetical protein
MDLTSLGFNGDSSYQNTSEYIGALIGVIGLVQLGLRGMDIELRGDSMSALTWAETERPRGELVTNATMVYTVLCVTYGIETKRTSHICGDDNYRCDKLSRLSESGQSVHEVLQQLGLHNVPDLGLEKDCRFRSLIDCCGPATKFKSEKEFETFWREIKGITDSLTPPFIPTSPSIQTRPLQRINHHHRGVRGDPGS